MESAHIDKLKLQGVVAHTAVLTQSELEHLKTCDECLEVLRLIVRKQVLGTKSSEHAQ
jgi:hypothetical protein